jgi:hypothetical protein
MSSSSSSSSRFLRHSAGRYDRRRREHTAADQSLTFVSLMVSSSSLIRWFVAIAVVAKLCSPARVRVRSMCFGECSRIYQQQTHIQTQTRTRRHERHIDLLCKQRFVVRSFERTHRIEHYFSPAMRSASKHFFFFLLRHKEMLTKQK